jgi:hypothetical protein
MKKKIVPTVLPRTRSVTSAHRTVRKTSNVKKTIPSKPSSTEHRGLDFTPQMTDKAIFDKLNKIIRKNASKDRWMPHT